MANFNDSSSKNDFSTFQDFLNDIFTFDSVEFEDLISSTNSDFISVPTFYDAEPVWRGAAVHHGQHNSFLSSRSSASFDEPFNAYKEKPFLTDSEVFVSNKSKNIFEETAVHGCSLVAPELPYILMPSNFETNMRLDYLVIQIDKFLDEFHGISHTYVESNCEWTVFFLTGSSHSKFQIHIYSDKSKGENSYIIEGNRLRGDASSFRSFYSQLKAKLATNEEVVEFTDSFSMLSPFPVSSSLLPDNLLLAGLDSIFKMAQELTLEPQLEAAKILCDLTMDESFQQQLCESGCITVLYHLIKNSISEWAQQHAMSALANLSDSKVCQATIVDTQGMLQLIIQYASNGPSRLTEISRNAVFILANLSISLPLQVMNVLGEKELSKWLRTVDAFIDDRLKLHAQRAKESFIVILDCY